MTDTAEIRRKNDRMAGAQPDRKAVDLGEKKLSPEELKALQQTELSILEEADRICRENGILSTPEDCFRYMNSLPEKYSQMSIFDLEVTGDGFQ